MLTIRREQLLALNRSDQEQFEAAMLAHMRRYYFADHVLLGDAGLTAIVRAGVAEAVAYGFPNQGDARRLIHLRMLLGSGFLRDPLLPWAAECLAAGPVQAGTAARLLVEAVDHLEMTNGSNGQYALRAMLRAADLSFAQATDTVPDAVTTTLRLLRRIWPEKFRILPVERRRFFLAAAAAGAQAAGFTTPGGVQVFTVLMFLLGAEFASDPALPWASACLATPAHAGEAVRAQRLYDAAQAALAAALPLLPPAGRAA